MIDFFAFAGLINAITALSFGVLVIIKNWRGKSNILFFLMALSLAVWGVAYWLWLSSDTAEAALFWARTLALGSIFIPVFFFHWIIVLYKKSKQYGLLVLVGYSLSIFISLFSYTDLVVPTVREIAIFSFWPTAGIFYSAYLAIIYIFLVLTAIYILVNRYFSLPKSSKERGQTLIIIIGTLLGFGGGLTTFPAWYGYPLLPYGTHFVALFPFLLGYSALRHHLFNLKTIATELLVFFISVILLIQVVLSDSLLEQVLRGLFFIIVGFFGYLLVRSVYREVEQREEIQRLADKLEKANTRLKELDKLKSQFLSIASHDLRAPLTAIRNFMAMLTEGTYGKLPDAAQSGAEQVFNRATEMAEMVDSYLNVSRIEQGRMKYDFEKVDFAKVYNETIEPFVSVANEKGLTLTYAKLTEPVTVKVDVSKIREVIENLINNAINYTPEGSITVSAEKRADVVRVTFQDTGIGMSRETIGNLFKFLTPGENSREYNPKSTGVGLYITKAHVEAHKGKIWAESDGQSKGSRFIFELPLAK